MLMHGERLADYSKAVQAFAISTRPGMNIGQDVSSAPPETVTPSTTMSNIHAPATHNQTVACQTRRETCVSSQTALCFSLPSQALKAVDGGAGRDRTDDLKLAKLPLSQLSYSPLKNAIRQHSDNLDEHGGPGWTRTTDLTLIRRAL